MSRLASAAPSAFAERRSVFLPSRVRWALVIVLLFHGGLLMFGSYRGTYDAYVHIFLGDHYARDWFSTWDQRWYTGFTTVSYPPGTHMSIAALSKLTGSLELAFVIVQLSALLALTIGVYRFSRLWVDEEAAANASLLLATSSAIAETVHLYGQLPTTFALAFLLNALPFIRRWVFEGRTINLVAGTIVLAACTAGHHVTTLFGSVFFLGPVLVAGLLAQSRVLREDEDPAAPDLSLGRRTVVPVLIRRFRRIWPPIVRGTILGPCLLGALVVVVLPYWFWTATDPISQIPIPHGSRANFLADLNIGLVFFFIPWGLMLPLLPYALTRAVLDRMWPLAASVLLLFVLGTGGTTPIPKLLLGGAFDVLTLDRFTFWAAIQVLPLAGLFVKSLEHGSVAAWFQRTGGPRLVWAARTSFVLATVGLCVFSATLSQFRPFQPATIDPDPIVAFIEKDEHERWRFLTLGFGDQMAWLSARTSATQVDGNYHSVRRLPELTSTSVERLEGAKYRGISGLGSLQQFLEVPERYHLKFVFSNDRFYDPLLHFLGWQELGPLENGIVVWEKADIEPLPAVLPVRNVPTWQRLLWGVGPPATIISAIVVLGLAALGRRGSERDPSANTAVLIGPIRLVDRLLLETEQRFSPTEPAGFTPDRNRHGSHGLTRLRLRLRRRVGPRRQAIRLVALSVIISAVPIATVVDARERPEPTEVVEMYYDHLDFRRWRDAYELLDPASRPDYELWRLQTSVEGGILASYAKLDGVEASEVGQRGDRVEIDVDLRYLTALDWYPTRRHHELVERDGAWFVVPEEAGLTVPPDQLLRRPAVGYLIQGRRRVTSLTSDLIDIQDRPEIAVRHVRLIDDGGQPVIVGEVINLDVDPADLTLTGVLRSADGEIVARYNATDHLKRTLNPRETSPFRIDFEDVAAGTDVDFDPLDFTPVQLDERVVSAELYAKAVVTQNGLYRGLQLNDIELSGTATDGWTLEGEIRNDGLTEAVIPMVIVSFLDADGQVGWVERTFLDTAIRSQRSDQFSYRLPSLDDLAPGSIDVAVFSNGIAPPASVASPSGVVAAPPGSGFSSIRIDLVTMVPPGSSG